MNKRKIVFAYIPDYLFINDEKTPYGLLCLKEVLESSNQYTAEIWDYNLNLFRAYLKTENMTNSEGFFV